MDKVTKIVEEYYNMDEICWSVFLPWEESCRSLFEESFSSATSMLQIHGETLCVGFVGTGRRLCSQYMESYNAMRTISIDNDLKTRPGTVLSKHLNLLVPFSLQHPDDDIS
jgi:hypothetical protein